MPVVRQGVRPAALEAGGVQAELAFRCLLWPGRSRKRMSPFI
jgi:hypothetical protein